jgi:ribonuclease HI
MGTDRMVPRHVYDKPFTVRFPYRSERKDGFQPDRKGGLLWCTDGSKVNKSTGAGVYGYDTRRKLSCSLRQYITVFQAEVYAIKSTTVEDLHRSYRNRNICILSDSQAAIKALDNYQLNSKLVSDCHQSLMQLAKRNGVQLIWMLGQEGIVGNETADQLAQLRSEYPLIGPKPACGISVVVAKKAARDWTNRDNQRSWKLLTGLKQTKGILQGPSVRRRNC